jgi:hypothetical protein
MPLSEFSSYRICSQLYCSISFYTTSPNRLWVCWEQGPYLSWLCFSLIQERFVGHLEQSPVQALKIQHWTRQSIILTLMRFYSTGDNQWWLWPELWKEKPGMELLGEVETQTLMINLVNLTRLRTPRKLVKRTSGCCLWGCFQRWLAYGSANWVERPALNVGGTV